MTTPLSRTALTSWHDAHGARLVDFTGWSMPVQYTSITEEHLATRSSTALFDVSHMGRFHFAGARAEAFLERVVTRRVDNMRPGQIRYGLLCNQEGGILDDVLVYRLTDTTNQTCWSMVVNAGNRTKILEWLAPQAAEFEVRIHDQTEATAMIAVQGPTAVSLVDDTLGLEVNKLRYYSGAIKAVGDDLWTISRTGYTGEDGCELVLPCATAESIWQRLVDAGGVPAGLGARDTLRLEAAMPLYGHELNETLNPLTAGLSFAVDLDERQFLGSEALRAFQAENEGPPQLSRVGLRLQGRRVAREEYPVLHAGQPIGHVTSGTFSPTLQQSIAMAYVSSDHASQGTSLQVDVRGKMVDAEVIALPFYRRAS